jgi:hypothetical protein
LVTIFRTMALAAAALCMASAAQAAPWWGMASEYTIAPAGWRVVQQWPCPMDNGAGQSSYIWFPVTVCSVGSIDYADQSTWIGPASFALEAWVNRYCCGRTTKPNLINYGRANVNGVTCWARYTSYVRADAATEAEISAALGYPAHNGGTGYQDFTDAAGMSFVAYGDFAANPAQWCNGHDASGYLVATDVAVGYPGTVRALQTLGFEGVTLDYEPQDARTSAETVALVGTVRSLVKGLNPKYTVTLYTNPLDGPAFKYNGIFGYGQAGWNTDALLELTDYFTLMAYHATTQASVLAELKWEEAQFQAPDYGKFEVAWDLKNRLGDAQRVRPYVLSKGYAGVVFWGDGALWGAASCINVPNRELGILVGEPGC